MARPSNEELQQRKEQAEKDLEFKLVIYKELLAKKSDIQKEMDEMRLELEEIMVRGRIDKFPDRKSLLSITRSKNAPTRRFGYDKLKKKYKPLYERLVNEGFITFTEPEKEYKVEVRHLKMTKKDLDEWSQRAKQ